MTQGCWKVHPGPSQTAYGLTTQREEEARLATPEGRAETEARNAAVLAKLNRTGVDAIIYLQGLAGIVETEEQARCAWNGMSAYDQENTLEAYRVLGPR